MIIRSAIATDETKIVELIAQFRVELKALKGIRAKKNLEFAKEEFREYLEAKFPVYVAEESNKEILGYIVCKVEENVVWLESIFVSQECRGKGVADKLFDKAEGLAQSFGEDTVYNWVHPNNDKMIEFLAKRGYDVLNLLEIRKPWKDEILTQRIKVGSYEYRY